MSGKLTLNDAMNVMMKAMKSAADEALIAFGERQAVLRDGNRIYMRWADGSITNEVEAEYVQ